MATITIEDLEHLTDKQVEERISQTRKSIQLIGCSLEVTLENPLEDERVSKAMVAQYKSMIADIGLELKEYYFKLYNEEIIASGFLCIGS